MVEYTINILKKKDNLRCAMLHLMFRKSTYLKILHLSNSTNIDFVRIADYEAESSYKTKKDQTTFLTDEIKNISTILSTTLLRYYQTDANAIKIFVLPEVLVTSQGFPRSGIPVGLISKLVENNPNDIELFKNEVLKKIEQIFLQNFLQNISANKSLLKNFAVNVPMQFSYPPHFSEKIFSRNSMEILNLTIAFIFDENGDYFGMHVSFKSRIAAPDFASFGKIIIPSFYQKKYFHMPANAKMIGFDQKDYGPTLIQNVPWAGEKLNILIGICGDLVIGNDSEPWSERIGEEPKIDLVLIPADRMSPLPKTVGSKQILKQEGLFSVTDRTQDEFVSPIFSDDFDNTHIQQPSQSFYVPHPEHRSFIPIETSVKKWNIQTTDHNHRIFANLERYRFPRLDEAK